MATASPRAPRRSARWLGRALGVLTVGVLLAFSPQVGYRLSAAYNAAADQTRPVEPLPLPEPPTPSAALVADYARLLPDLQGALDAQQVSERRRLKLLEAHFLLYRQARMVLGVAQANTLMRLLLLEIQDETPGSRRASMFASPEAALASASGWLGLIAQVARSGDAARALGEQVKALAPVRMVPEVVLHQRQWIVRAASQTRLPPAVLAAIVDNEQAGNQVAYGLAGLARDLTDTVALRTTQMYGASGWTGRLSQTVGLTQMSWQDALLQRQRLEALGSGLGVPFPDSEGEARDLLMRPYANLLLTASRLVGYLNADAHIGRNSDVAHTDAWTYFLAPGWHNNPARASGGEVWPYAWNGFFKALLYERLLER